MSSVLSSLSRFLHQQAVRGAALAALVAGLGVTALATWRTADAVRAEAEARFHGVADRLVEEIAGRVMRPEAALRGAQSMMMASGRIDRATFRTFVAAREVEREFPGLRAIGFVERVPRGQLEAFVRRERNDGAPEFQVRASGTAPELLVVKYVEPLRRNQAAWGFDLATDPVRRQAAERAIASGQSALSAPLALLQDGAAGWLLFTPVYAVPAATPAERRSALAGVLFAAIAARDVLAPLKGIFNDRVDFQLRDAEAATAPALFDSRDPGGAGAASGALAQADGSFRQTRRLLVGGREFEARIMSTPQLEAGIAQEATLLVAVAGTALSLLLALAILRLARGRALAEARTREGEHLLHFLAENVPLRLAYWDLALRCRMANRALADLFGRREQDVIGRSLHELVPPERYLWLQPRIDGALRGEPQQFEWDTVDEHGEPATMLLYCIPDRREGQLEGLFMFATDVTELRRAREEAEQASDAKTQFLSNMSHEIRTPMNAVLGMLSLLRMTPLRENQADYAAKAEAAARSLLSLLNDVLDFSKIEAGKMRLDPRPFSFHTLLEDLHTILAPTVGQKPITLQFVLDPALPPWLVGDDMRLRQVLINLGGNAAKFTQAGSVVVRVQQVQRQGELVDVEVSVADTGIGISPEEQARIFEDFSQASASTTRSFGGTGLGLSICRRLVGLMGGSLQVDSTPGRGSRFHFRIRLPVAQVDADPQARPAPLQEHPLIAERPLRGCRLLVVEDNVVNQQVARELLTAVGAEVQVAGNGREAVLAVAGNPAFDAVLMDVQMPVMDGYQATREIRTKLRQTELPVIAMTANAMESDREQSRAAGMDDHVGKPFVPAELVRTLLRHIGTRPPPAPAPLLPPAPRPLEAQVQPLDLPMPPPPEDAAGMPVDRARAIAALGGDADLYGRLVPTFREDLRHALEQVQRVPGGLSREDASRLFHTLKSTAATLGAYGLSAAAAAAEDACEDPAVPLDAGRVAPLAGEMRRVLQALAAEGQPRE